MPIYEYLCEKCEREFEREQRISDPPIGTCPYCRSRKVKKLISRTSFVLKGGGWYSDLYSSSKPGARDGEKADSGASESAGAGASSEKADKAEKSEKSEKTKPEPASKVESSGNSGNSGKSAKSGKSSKAEKRANKKPKSGASGKSAA